MLRRAHPAEACRTAMVCSCRADAVRTAAVQCGKAWLQCFPGTQPACTVMASRVTGALGDSIAVQCCCTCNLRHAQQLVAITMSLKADDPTPACRGPMSATDVSNAKSAL